ncbi:hypothetical protein C6W23_14625 [Bacillus atrophaeus]|nr:hypothetical protein C6W23_14625 [Bacillus atrophaeus]
MLKLGNKKQNELRKTQLFLQFIYKCAADHFLKRNIPNNVGMFFYFNSHNVEPVTCFYLWLAVHYPSDIIDGALIGLIVIKTPEIKLFHWMIH